ncbi:hypothetical protein VZ95_13810 [Elstera litoralis]|uniref:DUF3768 domain-containing protein n=1 Tax=Elstera litoralis TaxID=552518 RepID=A0A0F3IQS9_9PROT|nr:DUF3768 domain-containing protein [Elstera litoralis]KJV09061.1 hypothetical protein VZ95_13810 [Elstera litoralis]
MTEAPYDRIRTLNDRFRRSFSGGTVLVTPGIRALPEDQQAEVLHAVRSFTAFDPGNDPYGEHDFGSVEIAGQRCFWKIDAYDLTLTEASPDPADPSVTRRVLTIMLASEY